MESVNTQGVMRVRKRVTLMVITVSIIFGICWTTNQVVFTLTDVAAIHIGAVPFDIAFTMVLFNSAVNPFVYALLNQQFKEKMKRMICCTNSKFRIQPTQLNLRALSMPTTTLPTRPTQQDQVPESDLFCSTTDLEPVKGSSTII